jgi:transcriptional regulator with XRE-family HTH domain
MGILSTQLGARLKILINAKNLLIKDVAESAGIRRQRLSGFLCGQFDIQSEALLSVFDVLGLNIFSLVHDQISIAATGSKATNSLGDDIEHIFNTLSPVEQKTFLSTLIRKANTSCSDEIHASVERVQEFKDGITFRRRGAC